MTPEQFKKHFAHLSIDINKAINSDIPNMAGNEAARLFRQNFQKEGFFGKKWQNVKRRGTRTITYKTKTGQIKTKMIKVANGAAGYRKILTGRTGDLGRSIKVKTSPGKAIIYSDLAYSVAHNEGTKNAGRRRNIKIPQRQFIGDSPELQRAIKTKIEETMNKLFRI
jgi:phage gpG-like protein